MPKITLLLVFLLCINIFAQKTVVLYISSDYSSIEYHLGVLSEIERLQIPIDSIAGSDWGNFIGALWSAGWSSKHIRELAKSLDSLPHAKQPQESALWQKNWLVKHREDGTPFLEEITEMKPYFGQEFFDLRVQESHWRSDVGSKIPFRSTDSTNNYPFPELRTENIEWRIFSTHIALRDTNGTAAQRYQQKLLSRDSALIILRPHSKPNPDSLFEAGIQAVQKNRSILAEIIKTRNNPAPSPYSPFSNLSEPPPPRFLYIPVFDSISAEFQGHLESFWNPKDTGILAVGNFLEALQKDGFYRNVKLTLDTSSFLQINAENSPQLSLSLAGYGGTLFGINAAANINFRFINQFGYNLNLAAFYGEGAKGIEPYLRFERFFMSNGDFFVKMKIYEHEPIPYFQRSIYKQARIIKENGNGVILGIEKPLYSRSVNKPVLQIAVEIDRREVVSGATVFPDYESTKDPSYEAIGVNSMFPHAKWLWQSEGYDRWFASEGFMAELMGGFKAVSVNVFGEGAPLYVSSSGKISITKQLLKYFSVSGGAEFGANFRKTDQGDLVLPDELYGIDGNDPAIDNRYRFAMGMGSYQEMWQTPNNSSHLYGLMSAGLSLQRHGSGIFLAGGFAKDGENPWRELGAQRLFAEPKIRIKTPVFNFVLGRSVLYSMKEYQKKSENRIFLIVNSD
jgi:hypothetical protein